MAAERIRKAFEFHGVVQGVGFRPAVYRVASRLGLTGWVQNCTGAVRLLIEGEPERVACFLEELRRSLPPLARLDSITELPAAEVVQENRYETFTVMPSDAVGRYEAVVTPDLRICRECLLEIFDPKNRRYGYAFTTCTNCGPRYTIVTVLPFDRQFTTMKDFVMCPACRTEYADPNNRRFHAETIACPHCGPQLWLEDIHGNRHKGDPVRVTRQLLAAGHIVAVRGIGAVSYTHLR
ncbi:MAG: acylphosphatase, partial [Kiritimatiellae bacterium]|nr:acylphosphatase [Kiritimatiellia bacterium]